MRCVTLASPVLVAMVIAACTTAAEPNTDIGIPSGGGPSDVAQIAPLDDPGFDDFRTTCARAEGGAHGLGGAGGAGGADHAPRLLTDNIAGKIRAITARDGFVYFSSGAAGNARVPVAGGEPQPLGAVGAPWLEVDDEHLYFASTDPALDPFVSRYVKEGGGIEHAPIPEPLPGNTWSGWAGGVLTQNYVVALYDFQLVAVPKQGFDRFTVLTGVGEAARDLAFDGKTLYWHEFSFSTPSIESIELRSGARSTVLAWTTKFDSEDSRFFGVDCAYAYFQVCETYGHFCAVKRISKQGGDPETFDALSRVDALGQALAVNGALYFSRDGVLSRLSSLGAEPEELFHTDNGSVQALQTDGENLYFAVGTDEQSVLYAVSL